MKCIIIEVKNKNGETITRIGINEEEFKKYLEKKAENGDLGVNNFGRFLQALFTPVPINSTLPVSLTDVGGAGRTVYITRPMNLDIFNTTLYAGLNKTIKVGTSSVAPSKTDYNLKGTVLGSAPVSPSWNDGGDYVDLTAGFNWTSDQTIYEIGLFYDMNVYQTVYTFMLDRTVISAGIYVPAGSTLTITYRLAI